MTLDVVNQQNEKVGTVEVPDDLLATDKMHLVWESVVRDNAADRRGTHATKSRGLVSGTGKKPYKQKGTGRAQAGETRSPLWRKGGTVFGPQPRSYDYAMPRKQERGALRDIERGIGRVGAAHAKGIRTLDVTWAFENP